MQGFDDSEEAFWQVGNSNGIIITSDYSIFKPIPGDFFLFIYCFQAEMRMPWRFWELTEQISHS